MYKQVINENSSLPSHSRGYIEVDRYAAYMSIALEVPASIVVLPCIFGIHLFLLYLYRLLLHFELYSNIGLRSANCELLGNSLLMIVYGWWPIYMSLNHLE